MTEQGIPLACGPGRDGGLTRCGCWVPLGVMPGRIPVVCCGDRPQGLRDDFILAGGRQAFKEALFEADLADIRGRGGVTQVEEDLPDGHRAGACRWPLGQGLDVEGGIGPDKPTGQGRRRSA